MKSFIVGLLLLTSCANHPPPVEEKPLGRAGSVVLKVIEPIKICLQKSRDLDITWPVEDASYNWNKNGLNLFTTNSEEETCKGIVLITQTDTSKWLGSTEFFNRNVVSVQLSSLVVEEFRLHVLCHELGHVLGLPHSSDSSCMNDTQHNSLPTETDLKVVNQAPWSAGNASRSMIGHK